MKSLNNKIISVFLTGALVATSFGGGGLAFADELNLGQPDEETLIDEEFTNDADLLDEEESDAAIDNNDVIELDAESDSPFVDSDNIDSSAVKGEISLQSTATDEVSPYADEDFSLTAVVNELSYNAFLSYDGKYYLYLPAGSELANVNITLKGNLTSYSDGITYIPANAAIVFTSEGEYQLVVNEKQVTVDVVVSNIPTVNFSLNGTTLSQINAGSKDIKYKENSVGIYDSDGSKVAIDSSVELKGRGNYTWNYLPKKGYQFKLSDKANLFGMGKSKTWILLANYEDGSLLRNACGLSLAESLGMSYTSKFQFVDLWVDGEYQGNYMLCEKVQIGNNRVELSDAFGVLAELDCMYYSSEDYWFQSSYSNGAFALKDSVDELNEAQAFKSFQGSITDFERELYGDKNWSKISQMIDVDSFINWYFVKEFAEDIDSMRSSLFIYKNGENDVIHLGPVWDFDSAFGNHTAERFGGSTNVDYIINITSYIDGTVDWFKELFSIPEFCQLAQQKYKDSVASQICEVQSKVKELSNSLEVSALLNIKRWNVLGNGHSFNSSEGHKYLDTYDGEVSYLTNWMENRAAYFNTRYSTIGDESLLAYSAHVQNVGWQSSVLGSNTAGTTGRSLRMEALTVNAPIGYSSDSIKVSAHVQNVGWQNWVNAGQIAGTVGQSLRLEAIRIKLTGELSEKFDIYYRVHVQNQGWLGWSSNGDPSGTQGLSLRVEAIQIKLLPKGTQLDTSETAFIGNMVYQSHVQDTGWMESSADGSVSGIEGQNLRLEAIVINENIANLKSLSGTVRYRAHIQNIGWQDWVQSGEVAGTTGQSLRMEALQLELTEDLAKFYDISYRVYVQGVGWTSWVSNGEIAGTTGQSLQMEALQIKVALKSS